MSRLQELYQITKKLEKLFEQTITSKNRESIIEEISYLIDQRGKYMDQLTPPYTETEKKLGKEIVHLNRTIEKEMNKIFRDLKREMQQMKIQKKSNQSYMNPFKSVQALDGMYMDSKN